MTTSSSHVFYLLTGLCTELHAKYYRSDNQCLVGSANLTASALGWSARPNLELLIEVSSRNTAIKEFEATLFAGSILVTQNIFDQTVEAVAAIRKLIPEPLIVGYDIIDDNVFSVPVSARAEQNDGWIPSLRNPADLYLAYTCRMDELTNAARSVAVTDLAALPVAANLPRDAFNACIGGLLLQKPIVCKVDEFLKVPRRFGAVRDLLASLPCARRHDFDAEHAWQTLMRWLLYFLPARYKRVPSRHSEVLVRVVRD